MRVRRSKDKQSASRPSRRPLAVESLGSRVVLSAGGLGAGFAPFELQELTVVGGAIGGLHEAASPRFDLAEATYANTPGTLANTPGAWIAPKADWRDQELGRGFTTIGDGMKGSPRDPAPIFAAPQALALSQSYGINLVVMPTLTWTFTINPPVYPAGVVLRTHDFEPPFRGVDFGSVNEFNRPGAPYEPTLPSEPVADHPGTVSGSKPPGDSHSGAFDATSSRGTGTDPHASGVWLVAAPSATVSVTSTSEGAPASKMALAPNRLETSTSDVEGGLIELDGPTLPRSQRSLKASDDLTDEESTDEEAAAIELQKLLDKVWSGWDRVWDAFGEMNRASQGQEEKQESSDAVAAVMPDGVVQMMADAEGGMIELAAQMPLAAGPAISGSGQASLMQMTLDEGKKVRMDAGVALYHSFELATAPDAVPPAATTSAKAANANGADADSAIDETPDSKEESTETQFTSATLVGAGLLLSVPFSVFRTGRQDERLNVGRLKVEQLD